MAMKSVDSQSTQGITKASGGFLISSSMGKAAVSSNNQEHNVPNYRRASIGSCHDFCKYGKKHEIKPKKRFPTIKSVASKSFDSHIPIQVLVPPERNKSTTTLAKPSRKPSPDLETAPVSAAVINTTKIEVSVNSPSLTQSPAVSKVSDEKKKKILVAKTKPSSYFVWAKRPSSYSTDISNSSTPKAKKPPKQASPSNVEKKSPSSGDTNFSKPRYMKEKPVISSRSLGGTNGRRNIDVKIGKSTAALKGNTKKASKITSTVSSSSKNANRVANSNSGKYIIRKADSAFKNLNKIGKAKLEEEAQNVEVKEKTLYVVKIETENNSRPLESNALESSPKPLESDPYEADIFESSPNPNSPLISSQHQPQSKEFSVDQDEIMYSSEDEEVDNDQKEETLEGRKKKNNKLSPEERDAPASKLSFQRGKVVDVQSENNKGPPRRLKFKRGKVSGEDRNYDNTHRRNFKREANNRAKESEPAPEEVVLRHQDLQEKKDAQGLFNNVIEETASKLVETRKSKVKALVGAFETVISLQECKASLL